MVSFYNNAEKRVLNPQLFSKIAEDLADTVYKSSRDSNKRSQLRKFFDEVIRLNSMSKSNPDDWDNILPYVNMLIAKAVYAEGRKKVTGEFVNLMKGCISQVRNSDDLDVFANFFEAFMGFYRKYGAN